MRGFYHTYRSDYPNHVHQLNFSISQNYYLLKSGEIKYQTKKFDVNWRNYEKTGKRHLVNILVRDHFSNCFYAEIHPIDKTPDIKDFLFNAWKEKEGFEFCGIPKNLILGKHILERFPNIMNFAAKVGLNVELAQNGFATGIRSIKDWESHIRFIISYEQNRQIQDFQSNVEEICRKLNLRDSGKTEPNLLKWLKNEPRGSLINDKKEFEELFIN